MRPDCSLHERRLLSGQARTSEGESSSGLRRRVLGNVSALDQSRDATASLRRTREVLAQEVQRVASVAQVLDEDAAKIDSTKDEYGAYSRTVGTSKGMLKEMQRRETKDKLLVGLAALFFFACAVYVVGKRLRLTALIPFHDTIYAYGF